MSKTAGNALDYVNAFLKEARAEKRAAFGKAATDPSDSTSHPVMNVDDGTKPATEGSRSSENASDVKKDYGDAGMTGQEDASSASAPKQDIGTQKMESDETKGNVATPKATKDKPDESAGHPSNSTFNEKYSSVMDIGKRLISAITELNKTAAAQAPVAQAKSGTDSKNANTQVDTTKEAELKYAAAQTHKEDAEAGYLAAEMLAGYLGFGKQASETDVAVDAGLANIVKTAEADAQLLADFIQGHNYGLQEASKQRTKSAGGLPPEMMGGADPMAGGGGGDPMGGMGGGAEQLPPELAGADAGNAAPGGGGDEQAVIEQLAQALDEAGVTPEELVAALQGAGGGEGGGDPMGGAGGGEQDPMAAMMGGGGGAGGPPGGDGKGTAEEGAERPAQEKEEKAPPKEDKNAAFKGTSKGIPGKVRPSAQSVGVKAAAASVKALTATARQTKLATVLKQMAAK